MDDDLLPSWEDEPYVVFFNGVHPDRYDFDALFTRDLMDSLRNSENPETGRDDTPAAFDKVPEKFVSADSWPRTTNLRCRQCTRQFKSRPLTVITKIFNEGHVIIDMKTDRCFYCSGDCVETFINNHVLDEGDRWSRKKMFSIFYRKLTGVRVDSFPVTNTPAELEIFGGDISIDDHVKSLKFIVPASL